MLPAETPSDTRRQFLKIGTVNWNSWIPSSETVSTTANDSELIGPAICGQWQPRALRWQVVRLNVAVADVDLGSRASVPPGKDYVLYSTPPKAVGGLVVPRQDSPAQSLQDIG